MAIEIGSIGYNHTHDKNFINDLPDGPGAYLFLLVKSAAFFRIKDKNYNVLKNSYVLLSPNTSCMYKANKDLYIDDWFFFWMTEEDKAELIKMGIKIDEPVYCEGVSNLSVEIHQISFEHFSSSPFHEELKQAYTNILFYKLSRIINTTDNISPDILATKNDKLTYLKSRIYDSPDSFINVDELADFMNLSRSGFQHLYQKTFGINIIQDIIKARIKKAKELLKSTNLTLSEIGTKCGYKTEYHFMRQFKTQTGFTPTQFRNSDSWNQIEELQK